MEEQHFNLPGHIQQLFPGWHARAGSVRYPWPAGFPLVQGPHGLHALSLSKHRLLLRGWTKWEYGSSAAKTWRESRPLCCCVARGSSRFVREHSVSCEVLSQAPSASHRAGKPASCAAEVVPSQRPKEISSEEYYRNPSSGISLPLRPK